MIPENNHFKQCGVCEGGGHGFFSVPCFLFFFFLWEHILFTYEFTHTYPCPLFSRWEMCKQSFFLQVRSRNADIQSPRAGSDTWKRGKQKGFLNWKEGVDSGVRNWGSTRRKSSISFERKETGSLTDKVWWGSGLRRGKRIGEVLGILAYPWTRTIYQG